MKLTEEQGINASALTDELVAEQIEAEVELKKIWFRQARLLAICFGNDYAFKQDWADDIDKIIEKGRAIMNPQQVAESKARGTMGIAKTSWLRSVDPSWETVE